MKRIIKNEFFIAVVLVITTMAIASCDFSEFAIPESVTIKGNPGVHIPLGSPFVGEYENIIEEYLGTAKLLEMMGGAADGEEASLLNGIGIYEYAKSTSDARTFIVHYPIAKMDYDLGQYMQTVYDIKAPKITGIDLRQPTEVKRFFPGKKLSDLLKMTDTDVRNAVDDKIDEWVDSAAGDKAVDTGIPAAQSVLDNFSNLLKSTPTALQPQLIATTKAEVKALTEVNTAKDTAVSGFNTLKDSVKELKKPIEIPLGDIAKLVEYVDIKKTGLKIEGSDFYNKIEMAIPQFGIGSGSGENVTYDKGRLDKNDDLNFTTNDLTNKDGDGDPETFRFEPDLDKPNLLIYVNIIDFMDNGPVSFEPTLVFDWTEASVNPGEHGELTGTYEMNFGNIKNFLGDSFEPPEVKGYLYINNLPESNPTVELSIKSHNGPMSENLTNGAQALEEEPPPQFPEKNGEMFEDSLPPASLKPIKMNAIFETQEGSYLEYTVKLGIFILYKDEIESSEDKDKQISADIVIEVPLEFKVTAASPVPEYVSLDLKGEDGKSLLPEMEGDLFGRDGKGGTIDEMIGYIGDVTITLKELKNNVIDGAAIYIQTQNGYDLLTLSKDDGKDPSISLGKNDVGYPFKPKFGILIPCDTGKNYGTLKIGKATDTTNAGYEFDFNLVVEAKASLDKTIDF